MSKLTFVLLAAGAMALGTMVSCSKSSNNNGGSGSSSDSVLYSKWIPLNMVIVGAVSDSNYEQQIAASALTASVLNKGLVLVYANETGSGGQYVNYVSDFGIYPTFGPQVIYLDAYGPLAYQLASNQIVDSVRYVIIPGKVSTTDASGNLQTYTPSQLRQMDYGTLSKVLNIPASGSSLK